MREQWGPEVRGACVRGAGGAGGQGCVCVEQRGPEVRGACVREQQGLEVGGACAGAERAVCSQAPPSPRC